MNQQDPSDRGARRSAPRIWEVYRALHGMSGSEAEVLAEYPDLTGEDLAAVEAYFLDRIRTRTRDEITGRPILSKVLLKHGAYYKGRCRSATIARWNAEEQQFYHWREKFGRIYIETIRYPTDETEAWWDTFSVVEELLTPTFEIPFDRDATFDGDPDDMLEFQAEMWGDSNKHMEDLRLLQQAQAAAESLTIDDLRAARSRRGEK